MEGACAADCRSLRLKLESHALPFLCYMVRIGHLEKEDPENGVGYDSAGRVCTISWMLSFSAMVI